MYIKVQKSKYLIEFNKTLHLNKNKFNKKIFINRLN